MSGKEVQLALRLVGAPKVAGRTILDYCCGTGMTAIYFALCGANVRAFDASEAAVGIARQSARLSGVEQHVEFAVAAAQDLPYAAGVFDGAFCRSALHIIADYAQCRWELARVLKPGARAVFCEEPLGHNPLLQPVRYLRRRKYRHCGGRPLKYQDIRAFGEAFSRTSVHHFRLFAQSKLFGRLLRRPGPLRRRICALLRALDRADRRLCLAAPWLERFCGSVVVEYTR